MSMAHCGTIRAGAATGLGLAAAVLILGASVASGQDETTDRESPPGPAAPANDPVARLQARLSRGEAGLEYDATRGYLPAVLEAMGMSTASQVLVFSKTSSQHARISPRNPRALYFADDVYVGWVPGGDVLEISAVDPERGAVFYLLDQGRSGRPEFERQEYSCLSCHESPRTGGVAGHLVRSVYPAPDGRPVYNAGTFDTDQTSPLAERWGGWYVSGTHGDQRHMGNAFLRGGDDPAGFDLDAGANVTDLTNRFNTARYPTPHSDLVALMVLEHQVQMHNRIAVAGDQARTAEAYDRGINEALGRPADHRSPSSIRRVEDAAEKLVHHMLFVDEATLSAPVAGTSGFAEHFAALGPRDDRGRSLRDLDLTTRLFRYPCSYLIHSDAFDALPPVVKDRVHGRLVEILSGRDRDPAFDHLTPDLRREILEILRATTPDFPGAGPPGRRISSAD